MAGGKAYYVDTLVGEYNPKAVQLEGSSWGRPTELKVGIEWGDGTHFAYKVIGRDTVTVPAGTFPDAYLVEMQVDDTYTDRLYYVDGVGLVKEGPENYRALLSFTPGTPQ